MKPSVKEKWLEALRSGEYRKARDRLHRENSNRHCCLGVLDLEAGLRESRKATLSAESCDRVGMTPDQRDRLTTLNDNHPGWDKVIAYIEREL